MERDHPVVRVMALIWVDVLAIYAMWLMMPYLTNVWKLNFTHAAAILNLWWGATAMLPTGMLFLVDTLLGNFSMLLISSLAYGGGLGLLSMSTPPVLAKVMGNCSEYKSECIGGEQKILFYTALALTAVGMSGHKTSLEPFMVEQAEEMEQEEMSNGRAITLCLSSFAIVLVPIVGVVVMTVVKPWSIRFGIPAIFTAVATMAFLSGSCWYNYVGPQGSPLTSVLRVFVASASKMFYRPPRDANQLYETSDGNIDLLPHTRGLRCLDKAAIILPNQAPEQQEKNRWRLCAVTEVEETKIAIRMIPMWITFIICGLVSSIGNTYFLAQSNHLDRKLGHIKVPLILLLWFYENGKSLFANIYSCFASSLGQSRRYVPAIGIAVSMVFSILCCITAAKVETRRLDVVNSHGLLDKPDEKIPMNILWLLPQFVLLGAVNGIFETSVASFFRDQAAPSMKAYLIFLTDGVFGLGIMGSVLSVYLAETITGRGGKLSWFQDTLNKSRLDNYYWLLAVMSSVNLVVYILVAVFYAYRDAVEDEEELDYNEEEEPIEANVLCCC